MSYTGWHTLDVLPHRDDVIRATQESVFWLRGLHNLMDKIDRERFGVKIISDDSNEDFQVVKVFRHEIEPVYSVILFCVFVLHLKN